MNPPPKPEEWVQQITAAVADLSWTSETDAPFEVLLWTICCGQDLASQVLHQAQLPLDTPTEAVALDIFLEPVTQPQSWHTSDEAVTVQKFQALAALLKQALAEIQVYRCGVTELDIYIVGQASGSVWIALHTTAVET